MERLGLLDPRVPLEVQDSLVQKDFKVLVDSLAVVEIWVRQVFQVGY